MTVQARANLQGGTIFFIRFLSIRQRRFWTDSYWRLLASEYNSCLKPMPEQSQPAPVPRRVTSRVRRGLHDGIILPLLLLACRVAISAEPVFPDRSWEQREPAALGMDAALLDQLANQLGGRGCVVKDGYMVKAWGDQSQVADVLSSAKPVLSTLLFFAIEEGLVKSVDQPIAEFGWELKEKDRGITFRHLGAMNSGYARPESPGEAWAYNDYAIQLYQMTLFDKVFKEDAKRAAENPTTAWGVGIRGRFEIFRKEAHLGIGARLRAHRMVLGQ